MLKHLVLDICMKKHVHDTICKMYWSIVSRDLNVIHTSSNEAYLTVKQTRGTGADSADYETPLSVHPSSQRTAGDSLYEPV